MVTTSPELTRLLERHDEEGQLSEADALQFGSRPGALDELLAYARAKPAVTDRLEDQQRLRERQRAVVPLIIYIGRPMRPARDDIPEIPAPIVIEPKVVAFLVESLESPDDKVRNAAGRALAEQVPATSLEPYSPAILASIQRHPTIDRALRLLGKTANRKDALDVLERTPGLEETDSDDAIMVRARLGEPEAEDALYRTYQDATDAEERGALAPRLGYAATPRLVNLLADEIRSPDYYVWNKLSRCSLRVHIIEGLGVAFPTEPVFWHPFFTPLDDGYYIEVEEWLTRHLGTKWTRPRPEFLYREEAPAGP